MAVVIGIEAVLFKLVVKRFARNAQVAAYVGYPAVVARQRLANQALFK